LSPSGSFAVEAHIHRGGRWIAIRRRVITVAAEVAHYPHHILTNGDAIPQIHAVVIGTTLACGFSGNLLLKRVVRTRRAIGVHAVSQDLSELAQLALREADIHADAHVRL